MASFYPSIGQLLPLKWGNKNMVAAHKNQAWYKGKTAGICREKRKEIRGRVQLQSLIFLIRCGKNPVIYDDPTPLSSFQCPSSIQSLNLALFDSVLGPKKILWISPANSGKNTSRGQESLLSTLDIQTGISWAFVIEIKRFKSPNSSTCPRLQLW